MGLLAASAGTCLYMWSARTSSATGSALGKLIGLLVLILAIISIWCSIYYGIKLRQNNYNIFTMPAPMHNNFPSNTMPINQPNAAR